MLREGQATMSFLNGQHHHDARPVWYRSVLSSQRVHPPIPRKQNRHRHERSGDWKALMPSTQRKEEEGREIGWAGTEQRNLRDICPSGEGLNISGVGTPLPPTPSHMSVGCGPWQHMQAPPTTRQEGRS